MFKKKNKKNQDEGFSLDVQGLVNDALKYASNNSTSTFTNYIYINFYNVK